MSSLSSIEIERHSLKGILKYPNIFPDIDLYLTENDFVSTFHRNLYLIIKPILMAGKPLDQVLLANSMINLGLTHNEDLSTIEYIEVLFSSNITEEATREATKELVRLRILRDVDQTARNIHEFVKKESQNKQIVEIIEECDRIYHKGLREATNLGEDTQELFGELENVIENIANNPPDDSKFMMGAFDSVNRLYGSLSRPSNVTIVGSRSGVGKTSLGMFYNTYLAEKYNIPILHLDMGEMSPLELQTRAVCCLSKGKVPLWAIESGEWRNNNEWFNIVRNDIWPRVKKLKMYYQNACGLKPNEIISLIRRIAYQKIGKGNMFIVHYDYLKPFDTGDYQTAPWIVMGNFIQDIKSFIETEIPIPFWASLQLNRMGVTNNKTAAQLVDNEETFSISDRILQQSTHSILVRQKVMEELAFEENRYGNLKAKFLKHRHLGKDFEDALTPVKVGKGKYEKNYVNLDFKSFYFEDKGDLKSMVADMEEKYELGQAHHRSGDDL